MSPRNSGLFSQEESSSTESFTKQSQVEITAENGDSFDNKSVSSSSSDDSYDRDTDLTDYIWPRTYLWVAYGCIILTSFSILFAKYTSTTFSPFVTSGFKNHSEVTSAAVINRIASIVTYPIMAKCADIFGRGGGFIVCFFITTMSYVMFASCSNITAYLAANIFSNNMAYITMIQIFVSDNTSYANRGFLLSLPEAVSNVPALYLGSIIAQSILDHSTWRWGYGMWAIIIPVTAIPIVTIQFMMQNRAKRAGFKRKPSAILQSDGKKHGIFYRIFYVLWFELDLPGAALLIGGLGLTLIPITLTASATTDDWHDSSFIGTFVGGFAVLGVYFLYEIFLAKHQFIPLKTVFSWPVAAALTMNALDFLAHSLFDTLFPSFLLVAVPNTIPAQSTRIDNSIIVADEIASVFIGFIMRATRRPKFLVFLGVPLAILGQGLTIYFTNIGGTHTASHTEFVLSYVLYGVGRGFYQTSAQVIVQRIVPKADIAITTAVFYSAKSVGAAIGDAIGGGYWNYRLPIKLREYLPVGDTKDADAIFKSIDAARGAKGDLRVAVDRAYRSTFQTMAIMSTSFLIPMLLCMFLVTDIRLETRKEADDRVNQEREDLHNQKALEKAQQREAASDFAIAEKSLSA